MCSRAVPLQSNHHSSASPACPLVVLSATRMGKECWTDLQKCSTVDGQRQQRPLVWGLASLSCSSSTPYADAISSSMAAHREPHFPHRPHARLLSEEPPHDTVRRRHNLHRVHHHARSGRLRHDSARCQHYTPSTSSAGPVLKKKK